MSTELRKRHEGRSGGLSSEADQSLFALLRSLADVILVGGQTARTEGYQPVLPTEVDADLRARLGLTPTPAIAVVSRSMDFDPGAAGRRRRTDARRSPHPARPRSTPSCSRTQPSSTRAARATRCTSTPARIVDQLGALGYQRILCEGGPSMHYGLVVTGRLDELCLTISPQLSGGDPLRILTAGPHFGPPVQLELRHLLSDGRRPVLPLHRRALSPSGPGSSAGEARLTADGPSCDAPAVPMLAKSAKGIPDPAKYEDGLLFEPKWDGFRCIVFRDGDEVELGSRNERPLTRYFPEVVEAVKQSLPERCVVDGEIVVARDGRLRVRGAAGAHPPGGLAGARSWRSRRRRRTSPSTCSRSATSR